MFTSMTILCILCYISTWLEINWEKDKLHLANPIHDNPYSPRDTRRQYTYSMETYPREFLFFHDHLLRPGPCFLVSKVLQRISSLYPLSAHCFQLIYLEFQTRKFPVSRLSARLPRFHPGLQKRRNYFRCLRFCTTSLCYCISLLIFSSRLFRYLGEQ